MLTKRDIENHPHRQGIIVCPDEQWIWLKPCRVAGTAMKRDVLAQKRVLCCKGTYSPSKWKKWLNGVTDDDLAHYWVWTFTRDSVDRLLSALQYFNISVGTYLQKPEKHHGHSFVTHSLPLSWYEPYADWVGRYEQLQTDWLELCRMLGMEQKELGQKNRTKHVRPSRLNGKVRAKLEKLARG